MSKAARPTLRDRAAAIPAKPGGRHCILGKQVAEMPDRNLAAEVVELVLDSSIIADNAVAILTEPDVDLYVTADHITRHRAGKCRWCKMTGTIVA